MRINFDFGDLEAFLAVKETGSFHLAGEKLNLSQSAITRRIKKLEQALDSQLFERTTREVRPTLAAKRLQARAEAILDSVQETSLAMRDESVAFVKQRLTIVTVAIMPSVVPILIPAAISEFRLKGHTARIRLLDNSANDVAEAVVQGAADFGIGSIPALEPSTNFEHLFDDEIVLAMPKKHPQNSKEVLSWSDLIHENLIVPMRGTGNRLLIDEAMASARLKLSWTYEVGRSTTALEMVVAGIGVALLPKSSAISSFGKLIEARPICGPSIARPIGLLTQIGHTNTTDAEALKQVIFKISKTV